MVEFLYSPEHFLQDLVRSTITLLVVIDPIGIVPIFMSLTRQMEKAGRAEVSKTVVITAAGLLFVFALAGTQIFGIFGISISSFMVAGGVLLFILAIELLTGGWRFIGSDTTGDTGVVPLAFPLLAGPGAITAVIISLETTGLVATVLSIVFAIAATYATLRYSDRIYRILGRRGSLIVTRVFAVFVAAIAIQYVVEGAKALFGL
ncbi:MarC family protein [Candidatus Nitrososphaera evergladensis]|nr:MarC family protein [Candidatus Nitrososphaera evergladensis]